MVQRCSYLHMEGYIAEDIPQRHGVVYLLNWHLQVMVQKEFIFHIYSHQLSFVEPLRFSFKISGFQQAPWGSFSLHDVIIVYQAEAEKPYDLCPS